MKKEKHSVDLTEQEIEVIQSALHTQEKILSVQSRAGGDGTTANRLTELKRVLERLSQRPNAGRGQGLFASARSLFG